MVFSVDDDIDDIDDEDDDVLLLFVGSEIQFNSHVRTFVVLYYESFEWNNVSFQGCRVRSK